MEGEIYYPGFTLENEFSNSIKVWISIVVSLCYCYFSAKFVPQGMPRLFSIIPVVSLFLALPLKLHSSHVGGLTAFFIAWLSNFKLLLFAFGKGPLSQPSLSLPHFIAIACFPIRIQQNPPPKSHSNLTKNQNRKNPPIKSPSNPENSLKGRNSQNSPQNGHSSESPYPKTTAKWNKSIWNYAVKVVLVALFVRIYEYSDRLHPKVILVIYCVHLYIGLEIMLVMAGFVAQTIFRFELEPQFDEPYLSTSLQDFWGRRWNLVVPRTLRPTIYDPVLCISAKLIGRKWAPLPAVMSTFVVSGLMHELLFYYMGRVWPTWEITWFFLLHGACLAVEIGIKKVVNHRFRLPQVIATPLIVGFVMVTSFRLFFPQMLRCKNDVRALEEYALVGAFVKNVVAGVVKSRVQLF